MGGYTTDIRGACKGRVPSERGPSQFTAFKPWLNIDVVKVASGIHMLHPAKSNYNHLDKHCVDSPPWTRADLMPVQLGMGGIWPNLDQACKPEHSYANLRRSAGALRLANRYFVSPLVHFLCGKTSVDGDHQYESPTPSKLGIIPVPGSANAAVRAIQRLATSPRVMTAINLSLACFKNWVMQATPGNDRRIWCHHQTPYKITPFSWQSVFVNLFASVFMFRDNSYDGQFNFNLPSRSVFVNLFASVFMFRDNSYDGQFNFNLPSRSMRKEINAAPLRVRIAQRRGGVQVAGGVAEGAGGVQRVRVACRGRRQPAAGGGDMKTAQAGGHVAGTWRRSRQRADARGLSRCHGRCAEIAVQTAGGGGTQTAGVKCKWRGHAEGTGSANSAGGVKRRARATTQAVRRWCGRRADSVVGLQMAGWHGEGPGGVQTA
ncbi:hypothetical protein GGX14DRAFT_400960 [Mycena pura]|uniref:Uncharacterized protein n=1 Tax=Mycena pura TaxID=153505 RepID=A0AAD6Y8X5_9AGAR|nr:hypothetical protein GGX14DRAFT_400960 [Mycena pura]